MKNRKFFWLSVIAAVIIWQILASIVKNSVTIPSPIETYKALIEIIMNKVFLVQILNTLKRVLIGFCIALSLGIIFGLISGFINTFYYLLKPLVLVQRSIPTMAVILLSLIWLNREVSPILVGVIVIFPIIYGGVLEGIRSIDKELLQMCKVYQFDLKKKILHLYFPSIKSSLRSISAMTLSLNIKITIAAEVLSQPKYSIGTGFQMEKIALNTAGVLAWAIIAIVIAGIFELIIKKMLSK